MEREFWKADEGGIPGKHQTTYNQTQSFLLLGT